MTIPGVPGVVAARALVMWMGWFGCEWGSRPTEDTTLIVFLNGLGLVFTGAPTFLTLRHLRFIMIKLHAIAEPCCVDMPYVGWFSGMLVMRLRFMIMQLIPYWPFVVHGNKNRQNCGGINVKQHEGRKVSRCKGLKGQRKCSAGGDHCRYFPTAGALSPWAQGGFHRNCFQLYQSWTKIWNYPSFFEIV